MKNIKKAIAEDTLETIKEGFYINPIGNKVEIRNEIKYSIENSILIKPNEIIPFVSEQKNKTIISLKNQTTLESFENLSKEYSKILCLNFASAKNPGGGFLGGAEAQEESLARSSGLYPTLLENKEMYESNKSNESCFYLEYMIYSPSVPVFKNDKGDYLNNYYKISFLTYPAVNAGVVKQKEPLRKNEIYEVMEYRIKRCLSFAKSKGYDCLILGAWGCGVFQNNPDDIAEIFNNALNLEFKNEFKRIEFAVFDKNDKGIFKTFEKEITITIFNQS